MAEFPEIPETPESLSAPELRALAAEIRQAILAAGPAEEFDLETADAVIAAGTAREELLSLATRKEAAASVSTSASDDSQDETPAVDTPPEEVEEAEEEEEAEVEASDDETEETVAEPVPVAAAPASALTVRTSTSVPATATLARVGADQLTAVEGLGGKRAGEAFENWTEFSQVLVDRAGMINPSSKEKYVVGQALADPRGITPLSEDLVANLRLFEKEEITAAMCAPAVPTYNLGCANTNRRPVRNSFASFQPAQRGAVSIYPSPTLEDITTGYGIWTNEEDSDPEAEKDPCATIECATPVEYRLYGVYRCLTVKNLLQLTFPELVEAYLNRLGAAWARLAEVTLLNAMGTAADTVDVTGTGWGGSTSLLRGILQYLAAYQELQRWDNPEIDAWMHRGVLLAVKADIMSRRRTDGGRTSVPSDAEVNAMFRDAGVNVTWTLDQANWMTPLQPFQGGGNQLRAFPTSIEILVAPRGKFAVMDRGQLSVGVTGNGIYRDNVSNSRNEFTFFFESFEGLVDTDSCPAHVLMFDNLCWNGRQIQDVFVGCSGEAIAAASGAL